MDIAPRPEPGQFDSQDDALRDAIDDNFAPHKFDQNFSMMGPTEPVETIKQFVPAPPPVRIPSSADFPSFPQSYVDSREADNRTGFGPKPRKRTRTTIKPPVDFRTELNIAPLLCIKPLDPSSIPLCPTTGPDKSTRKDSEEAKSQQYDLDMPNHAPAAAPEQVSKPPAQTALASSDNGERAGGQERMMEVEDSPDSSPKRSPGDSESEGSDKKSKQERNRESARKCRRRKKEYLVNLETEVKSLKEQLAACRTELDCVKAKLQASSMYQDLAMSKSQMLVQVKALIEAGQTAQLPVALNFIDVLDGWPVSV